ncbi:hypothetical protein D7231_35580 [Streptomyces klenkii]|uniref:Uncharacterized protein n=2 Tax=Streptomyces klenkii TaxID=1420899 RepID=A0A3A9ZTP1_9ACTN|nr:hypothetical protein D7231_35580 [Streptomyces klenkii]
MADWTPTTLLSVDEHGDRAQAGNGHSRYGAYIADRPAKFHAYGEPGTPLPGPEFAAAAWEVATPPVLLGYVNLRPGVKAVTTAFTDTGDLLLKVSVPLRHHDLPSGRRPRHPWQDWTSEYDHADHDDKYRHAFEPEIRADRPAVLTVSHLLLPTTGWDLPTPQHTEGRALVEEAKHVIHEIVHQVNAQAGPMVAQLLGDQEGQRRAG